MRRINGTIKLGGAIVKAGSNEQTVSVPINLLTVNQVNSNMNYIRVKRLLDIFFSLLGIILLSPLILIVAILIKKEDPNGPVIFKQVRVGKDETEFYMYK